MTDAAPDPVNAFADPTAGASTTLPVVTAKKPAKNKKAIVSKEIWSEVQVMYEGGNYSQRELVDYCKSRGLNVSQSRIARKAAAEGWIKGSKLQEIREAILDDFRKKAGDRISTMLDTHSKMSTAVLNECVMHFKQAQEMRAKDPNFVMSTGNLRNLTEIMRCAKEMEARELGFDYKTGKTVKDNDVESEADKPTPLSIRTMTPEEAKAHRDRAEKEFGAPKSEDDE
jgi:hypothetical protein